MIPLISVIVPCYNQAQYLHECLQSVLNQTFQDWECIIVNDGSPDHTEEVAKRWVEKDARFRYVFQENKGVSAARNLGIEYAKGAWILPLDGDDYISNDYLELAVNHFNDTDVKVIYCNAKKFGTEEKIWELKDFSLHNLAEDNLIFNSAFYRKVDVLAIGGYDQALKNGLEDWEFFINLLKNGGRVTRIDELCFFYRIKEVSRNTMSKIDPTESIKYIEKKHTEFFQEQFGTFHSLYIQNLQNRKVIETIIHKRKMSRLVNQIYSFIENSKFKITKLVKYLKFLLFNNRRDFI